MGGNPRPGVLVDLDGTLVDTNYLHTLAWARALDDIGTWASMAAIHHLIGMGGDRLLMSLLGHDSAPARQARAKHYGELIAEARVFPGARATLFDWHERGLAVVIASSSPRDELEAMLELIDADGAIDAVTSADDVDRAKPDADVFDAALAAGEIDRQRAVVVGDSVWDVHAAHRAGLVTIAVESGGTCAADLRAAGALHVHRDIGAIRGELSPSTVDALCKQGASHRMGGARRDIHPELEPPT